MAERASPVTRLPARPIDDVLDELVALRRRGGDAETPAPLVTLHFRSGRSLSGRVIDRVASPRAALLVQVVAGRDDGDALYVDPGAIEALQVHDAAAVASLLSDGKVASAAQPRPDQHDHGHIHQTPVKTRRHRPAQGRGGQRKAVGRGLANHVQNKNTQAG